MKAENQEHPPLIRLAAILYFMGSSMLVQFTTKVRFTVLFPQHQPYLETHFFSRHVLLRSPPLFPLSPFSLSLSQAIFTTYGFHFPMTVAMLQMAFISPVTYLLARPTLSLQLLRQLAPLAIVNVLNVVSGLVGTGGLNVPMFIALRRFTLLFTILLERYWLKKTHDWPTLSAMGIMIGGALIAAATDLTFNPSGYAAVMCNDLLTSLYLIMVKNTPATNGLSTTGMLFYNSTLSLPMLLGAMMFMGEPVAILTYPQLYSPHFLVREIDARENIFFWGFKIWVKFPFF